MIYPANVARWLGLVVRVAQGNTRWGKLHRECRQYAREIIDKVPDADPAFTDSHIYRKMIWYMVLDLWLGLQIHHLHGTQASRQDRRRYALSAPIFAAADFLIDDTNEPLAQIEAFTQNPDLPIQFPHRDLFRQFHHEFLATFPKGLDKKKVLEAYHRVHRVQFDSRGQKSENASQQEIDQWVRDKTGYSYTMVRALVAIPCSDVEEDAWYQLGALTQYCNDIQDLHKDLSSGVRNFATQGLSAQGLKKLLRTQQSRAFEAFLSLPISSRKSRRIRFTFEAFILVMEAKLDWYDHICEGRFSLECIQQQERRAVHLTPWHPFSLRRCIIPLWGYSLTKNERDYAHSSTIKL